MRNEKDIAFPYRVSNPGCLGVRPGVLTARPYGTHQDFFITSNNPINFGNLRESHYRYRHFYVERGSGSSW